MAEIDHVQFIIPLFPGAGPEDAEFYARAIMQGYAPAGGRVRVVLIYMLPECMPESLLPGHILNRLTGIVYQDPPNNEAVYVHRLEDFHLPAQVLVDVMKERIPQC